MHFGIYLVENGVLSHQDFYEALRLQLKSRPQLGALAIELRKLSCREVFAVLRSQCDAPSELFGELAVNLGFMTTGDLALLIAEQSTRSKPFATILTEHNILPAETVERHHAYYRRGLAQGEQPARAVAHAAN